jgi:hypothetical protein
MKKYNFDEIIPKLEKFVEDLGVPVVTRIKEKNLTPLKSL